MRSLRDQVKEMQDVIQRRLVATRSQEHTNLTIPPPYRQLERTECVKQLFKAEGVRADGDHVVILPFVINCG